jgi:hypothetical protein
VKTNKASRLQLLVVREYIATLKAQQDKAFESKVVREWCIRHGYQDFWLAEEGLTCLICVPMPEIGERPLTIIDELVEAFEILENELKKDDAFDRLYQGRRSL